MSANAITGAACSTIYASITPRVIREYAGEFAKKQKAKTSAMHGSNVDILSMRPHDCLYQLKLDLSAPGDRQGAVGASTARPQGWRPASNK
jgi:hypothetical protein